MSHFAEVKDGIVTNVIVAEQSFVDTLPGTWIQTSYNTREGVHYLPNSDTPSGQPALRGNYAGIGYTYDEALDIFMPPKPYPSWLLDSATFTWIAPVPKPEDSSYMYTWNEDTMSWVKGDKILTIELTSALDVEIQQFIEQILSKK